MATVTCPECQESVFCEAKVCPNCGYPLKKHTTSNFEFKFDPELAYKIAKEDCKESFIKLIIPVLWLAVPWLLLWIFTTMENIYSFMISFALASCISLTVALFKVGRSIEHDVTYYADEGLGFEKVTDVVNYGWLGILLGIVGYIGTIVLILFKCDEWWPGNENIGGIAIFALSLLAYIIPYTIRLIDFDYCCKYVAAKKDMPHLDTVILRNKQIEKRKVNELITTAVVYSIIVIVLAFLGFFLARNA